MSNFEFDGEKYKLASKHQKEWGNKLIAGLNLRGGETILDLGCGDGVLTRQLAALVPAGRVVGIDASAGMIETAKQLENDNLTFIRMDINNMPFQDEFDVLFSNAALHWVKDHRKLLSHSFAALKPNGRIAWNFAADGTCETFNGTVKALMRENDFRHSFSAFEWPWFMPSEPEYRALLAGVGFQTVHLTYENVDRYFADADEMIKWIDQPSLVPFLAQLPEEKKAAFRDAVVGRMIEKTRQPDGRCFETFRRLNIQAIK